MKHQLIKGLAALSLGLAATTASAVVTVDLCVGAVNKTMPANADFPTGEVVPMWGYGLDAGFATDPNCLTASVPGPTLTIPVGENALTVNLRNTLTGPGAEAVSMVIPGQPASMTPVTFLDASGRTRVRSFTSETAIGAIGVYNWTGMQPGTYLYHSGTHVQIQVPMGLYGALTRDPVAGQVYTGEAYDQEVTLLYSEVDPALNNAVTGGTYTSCSGGFAVCNGEKANGMTPSTVGYRAVYYLVNGESFTSKLQAAQWIGGIPAPSSEVLIRFLNAGNETHVPVIQGGARWRVISENGEPYSFAGNPAKTQYSVELPALTTRDVMLSISSTGLANTTAVTAPTAFAVYDRALAITNAVDEAPGGLISFLIADNDNDSDGVPNFADNCVDAANGPLIPDAGGNIQLDTNGDGFGNICDGDLNNDEATDVFDIPIFSAAFSSQTNPDADFNGDGDVNVFDIPVFSGLFGSPPGPAGVVP